MEYQTKVKKLPKSEVEVEVSLPASVLEEARRKALKKLSLSLELPGFRKGSVPEAIVLEKIGESKILEEAADMLVREHFPKIVIQEKLDILGQPKISVTKIASGNPLEFRANFAVMPTFELGDYKAVAKAQKASLKSEVPKVQAKEVDAVLLQMRKNKAHYDYHQKNPDNKDHHHPDFEKEENLPQLDDEFAKAAGNFKNLEELRAKIEENILAEKKARETEQQRAALMDELVNKTKIDLPDILVESEIAKSIAQIKEDIKKANSKWEDYLSHIKKTEEELKKDLQTGAERKAKIQLIFNKIASAEKLQPNKEILENEVKAILKHYPEANEENARVYVATVLLNQEVLKLLESQ